MSNRQKASIRPHCTFILIPFIPFSKYHLLNETFNFFIIKNIFPANIRKFHIDIFAFRITNIHNLFVITGDFLLVAMLKVNNKITPCNCIHINIYIRFTFKLVFAVLPTCPSTDS